MGERIVPLSDEQWTNLRERQEAIDAVPQIVADIVRKAAIDQGELRAGLWEIVRAKGSIGASESAVVDWVNRCIIVTGCDDAVSEEVQK